MIESETTRTDEMEKCPNCDAMVDPARLGDVLVHFFDGACVTGGERRPEVDFIPGEKVSSDA